MRSFHLERHFSLSVRNSGRTIVDSGGLTVVLQNESSLCMDLGEPFVTSIQHANEAVLATCPCGYVAQSNRPCKHLWATILVAENLGILARWPDHGSRLILTAGEVASDDAEVIDADDPSWDEEDLSSLSPAELSGFITRRSSRPPASRRRAFDWKLVVQDIASSLRSRGGTVWPPGREVVYVVDVARSASERAVCLELMCRDRKQNGDWGKPRTHIFSPDDLAALADSADGRLLRLLAGAEPGYAPNWRHSDYYFDDDGFLNNMLKVESPQVVQILLPMLCATGRCFLRPAEEPALLPLQWDERPWELVLEVTRPADGKHYELGGWLARGEERMGLEEPVLLTPAGAVFTQERAAPFDARDGFAWVKHLCGRGPVRVPLAAGQEFVAALAGLERLPRVRLPEELRFEEVAGSPRPRLVVRSERHPMNGSRLSASLSFDYEGQIVPDGAGPNLYDPARRRLVRRDRIAESAARQRLHGLGLAPDRYSSASLLLRPNRLPGVVRALLAEGWFVQAEGKLYRRAGKISFSVSSGIDWFELHGSVDFDGASVTLPALLKAIRSGNNMVLLGDGTYGMIPEEWLRRYRLLGGVGEEHDDHVRFRQAQVGMLDALLAEQPEATWDQAFGKAREQLRRFRGVAPLDAPEGFVGQLRPYQRDGLGWLGFLRQFGFGGCLADDMGLGKTVQVLAALEARRQAGGPDRLPSLVVVPRSLVFNWKEEAARFTPRLRILDHTGIERARRADPLRQYDIVLTTYGTLRRDVPFLREAEFDYVVLDEAQAVKNSASESAKAVRLLRGRHRLVLSGTPVQNHLGELWSLFEFLNPGMLGSASVFQGAAGVAKNPDAETRQLLARAVRPFVLRRTKQQVAADLPEKTEQTLHCELEAEQLKLYNELRDHYRQSLLGQIEAQGIGRSKIQILEALLRLRQAACHPGLIDKKRAGEPSAKLDALLPQLAEVMEEGHKALVFSQFTSFLAIVRNRLDEQKIAYEYLDGKTRDRAAGVQRFQTDPECRLFLVSLKAGGLGLNLTAAEYVFLLDPWWNPAIEAQAIDRAHRIGQTRQVFAYRLIARNTVEDKILELQQSKRNLADAIIRADNSLIRDISREDLELLLT